MARSFSMSRAWEANERMIRALDQKEGHYEGEGKACKKKIGERVLATGDVQDVEYAPNSMLGLDGELFRIGDRLVNNIKEERVSDTEVIAYFQSEDGKTYETRWEQTSDRGYTQTTPARRTFSF